MSGPKVRRRRLGAAARSLPLDAQGDRLLDESEAAEMLDVTVGTLQLWRSTKRYQLAYTKIGRNVRYLRSTILAFIASRTVAGDKAEG